MAGYLVFRVSDEVATVVVFKMAGLYLGLRLYVVCL